VVSSGLTIIPVSAKLGALMNFMAYRFHLYGRRLLQILFGFDRWHVSTYEERKYAVAIVEYLNRSANIAEQKVVEIGCGLGDIIRRIKASRKEGLDYDHRVCKAANFIGRILRDNTRYYQFRFPDNSLTSVYDVIIMVNWIHHIEPGVLKRQIETFFQNHLASKGRILIDTVHDPQYRFNHDVNFLTSGLDCRVDVIASDKRQRQVFSINKMI
jgi:SAM-dependent methyltransferase